MKIKTVRKTMESEKLPFNVEMILRSLKPLNVVAVNSVSVEFSSDKVDAGYFYSWKQDSLNFENQAIISLYENKDIIDILNEKINKSEVFDYIKEKDCTDISLTDIMSDWFMDDDIRNIFGSNRLIQISYNPPIQVSKLINDQFYKYRIMSMIKTMDGGFREIYLPNIALFCNYNDRQCMYMANKILNSPVSFLSSTF